MRLIRLVGNDEKGLIDNSFDTDIEIKKGQKIALQSVSFNERISILDLDDTNNEVVLQLASSGADNILTVSLTLGEYDKDNVETLFNEIRDLLCSAIKYPQTNPSLNDKIRLGMSIDCKLVSDRVNITASQSNLILNSARQTSGQSKYVNIIFTSPYLLKSDNSNTVNDDAKYYSSIPWSQQGGCMIHRVQIVNYVDTGTGLEDNGITLGLSKISPDIWKDKSQMTADEKTYYVRSNRNTDTYKTKIDGGTEQNSGVAPDTIAGDTDDNDYVEWIIDEGKLKCYLYRQSQVVPDLLVEDDYVQGTALYPFIIFHGGDSSIAVKNSRHTIDPFTTTNNDVVEDDEHVILHANPPPTTGGRRLIPTQTLTLSTLVANFFGFNNAINTIRAVSDRSTGNFFVVGSFIGDKIFIATLSNTSYMIELRNLKIESYNAESGTRQNIIAVVPKSSGLVANTIEYEVGNLYFINIAENGLFRNFSARLLRIDGSPIIVDGLSIVTLLIKDENE